MALHLFMTMQGGEHRTPCGSGLCKAITFAECTINEPERRCHVSSSHSILFCCVELLGRLLFAFMPLSLSPGMYPHGANECTVLTLIYLCVPVHIYFAT
jgi:hypothetical protein